jgi:hypothetical protein
VSDLHIVIFAFASTAEPALSPNAWRGFDGDSSLQAHGGVSRTAKVQSGSDALDGQSRFLPQTSYTTNLRDHNFERALKAEPLQA